MSKNYLFFDEETGEEFFVYADSLEEAKRTANEYFDTPIFEEVVDDYVADALGYDTY